MEKNQFKNARILKVKVKKTVKIDYEIEHNKIVDVYSLESEDAPLPELNNALQELRGHACTICELDEDNAKRIKVNGVSISYEGEEGKREMGVVISATRRLLKSNGTMMINTPYMLENKDGKKIIGGRPRLSAEAETQLYLVIDEARRYLNGERAQTSLPLDEKKGKR